MYELKRLMSFSILGTFCAFITQLMSVNILSVYDYGVVARWLTDITLFGVIFVMGFDHAILYYTKRNNKNFNKFLKFNMLVFTIFASTLIIIALNIKDWVYWCGLIITCYLLALFQTLNAYNQINDNIKNFGFNIFLKSFVLLMMVLIAANVFNISWVDYIKIYIFSVFLVLAYVFFNYYKKSKVNSDDFKIPVKKYFLYGFKSMANSIMAILLYSSTTYIVDYYLGKEGVAVFFAASVIAKLAWIVPDAIGNILYPKFLKIKTKEDYNTVLNTMYLYGQLNFAINLISLVIFSLIGWYFVDLIYGEKYKEVYYLIIIMLIGNQGMVFYKLMGRYYASRNLWSIQRESLFLGLISNIILNIILVNQLGLFGATISTAISFWICGFKMATGIKGSFKSFLNLNLFIKEAKKLGE